MSVLASRRIPAAASWARQTWTSTCSKSGSSRPSVSMTAARSSSVGLPAGVEHGADHDLGLPLREPGRRLAERPGHPDDGLVVQQAVVHHRPDPPERGHVGVGEGHRVVGQRGEPQRAPDPRGRSCGTPASCGHLEPGVGGGEPTKRRSICSAVGRPRMPLCPPSFAGAVSGLTGYLRRSEVRLTAPSALRPPRPRPARNTRPVRPGSAGCPAVISPWSAADSTVSVPQPSIRSRSVWSELTVLTLVIGMSSDGLVEHAGADGEPVRGEHVRGVLPPQVRHERPHGQQAHGDHATAMQRVEGIFEGRA